MNPETSKTMMVAALGRPFSLGMLYDCRQDLLIPGMTLWDSDVLENNIGERAQSYNDFEIVSSESIGDKSSTLNVEASLKASFLSGMVDVEGSAKYLHDDKTSRNQARVTLKYEATTKFQELSMDHLGRGNVKYPYVFDQGIATHVVTGILYGAKAFFVFDRDVSDDENHQDIEGYLKVMINKIPTVGIEGSGNVKLEEKDIEKVEKFSCKFHGDILLEKCPTTYQEAVEVYQRLPKLLGDDGENGVPMQVWLMPLTNLDSKAAKLVREISATFVEQAQTVLEDLKEAEIRCHDALKASITQQFPEVIKKLKNFKEMCGEFKVEFQRSLAQILPAIRGGGKEEAELGKILEKRISSPFNHTSLNEWMDSKEREIHTVMSFAQMMKSVKVITSPNHLFKEVLSVEHAVCYIFTSLESDEPYLSALSEYLKSTEQDDPQDTNTKDTNTLDVQEEQWYTSKELGKEMRTKAKLFSDFAEANKENKTIKFLAAGLKDEKHKGSSIYLYEEGFTVSEDFEPPSKPEAVTVVDINHDSVTLKISPPRFGADSVTSYSVEFCVRGEEEWKQTTGPKPGDVTVSDLKLNTEYVFRCRAVTSLGVGPASDPSQPIKTLPCSPPGGLHAEKDVCELSVSWEQPAEIGPGVQISNYIVEYAVKEQGVVDKDLHWNQIKSSTQNAILSVLQSDTEYAVRISCDCGGAGRSKESIPVVWRTADTYLLLLQEVLQDFPGLESKLNDASQSITVQHFPQIGAKLETFKSLCMKFKQVMLDEMKGRISSLLSRVEKERAIMSMLKLRNVTLFNDRNLRSWMQWKEREIQVVQSLTDMMPNTENIPTEDVFNEKIHSAENVMSFIFFSLGEADGYLSALKDWVDIKNVVFPSWGSTDIAKWVSWFRNIPDSLDRKAKSFGDFAGANKGNKNIKFLTVGLTGHVPGGAAIYLYKDGAPISENFEPPSKPEAVTVEDINHDSVTLKISPPRFGADRVTSYSAEFCVSGQDEWKQTTGPKSGDVTVGDLKPNTEYEFRCRAVTSLGVGPASDPSQPIKTLPCSPPGGLKVEPFLNGLFVSWEKPAEVGEGVQILNYIVEYGVNEKDLHWNQIRSSTNNVSISGLQVSTEFAVKVTCDCGEDGRSKESNTVICTTQEGYLDILHKILPDFPDMETKINADLQSATVQNFPDIRQKLETFHSLCMDFKKVMADELKERLSSVIKKEEQEKVIADMLEIRNNSPFKEKDLKEWMQLKEKEIQLVKSMTDMMPNSEIVPSRQAFQEKTHSAEYVVSFVLTSLGNPEWYLLSLNYYIQKRNVNPPRRPPLEWLPWFTGKEDECRNKAQLFNDFAEINKKNKKIKFLTVGLEDLTQKDLSIYLYKDGSVVSQSFELPSKPQSVFVSSYSYLFGPTLLKISAPKFGAENVTAYSVEYCMVGGDQCQQMTAPPSGQTTISGLLPQADYVLKCSAVTSAGVGPASDPITFSVIPRRPFHGHRSGPMTPGTDDAMDGSA